MGTVRSSATDWDHVTTAKTAGRTTADIFAKRTLVDALNPRGVAIRESRDSAANPESTGVVIGLDVTGSMGVIADTIARDGLRVLFNSIYDRKPVTDPHIMFMGIGDAAAGDTAPLQVSQFESSIVLMDQLTDFYLEHGGGGNSSESYTLPWYFAAMHTSLDCFEKRGKRGYLFTVGDEEPPEILLANELQRVLGEGQSDLTTEQLLNMVSRTYHVFHVIIEQGNHCSRPDRKEAVVAKWTKLLGQRTMLLSDYTKLAEVVVSAIEVTEGRDHAAVAKTWGGDTSVVVARAVGSLVPASEAGSSVVTF